MNCTTTITDWIMVAITFVYVVATIAIFVTNKNSEKAAYAQLEETKRQYEDKKRLEIMPYLQCEQCKDNTNNKISLRFDNNKKSGIVTSYPIEFVNIGNGTAKGIEYIFTNATASYERNDLPQTALQSGNRMMLVIQLTIPDESLQKNIMSFELKYKDLLDNSYSQKIEFYIYDGYNSKVIKNHKTFAPKYIINET